MEGSSIQERHEAPGAAPADAYKDDYGTGASHLVRKD